MGSGAGAADGPAATVQPTEDGSDMDEEGGEISTDNEILHKNDNAEEKKKRDEDRAPGLTGEDWQPREARKD